MVGRERNSGVVIVGAGHAGGRTAERLRHGGFLGSIDVVGVERELPYERPPLSKNVLTAQEVPSNGYLLPAARWNELGVRFHLGAEVAAIDRGNKGVVLADGRRFDYRRLVLATGLAPRRIPTLDPVTPYVAYLRSFEDALRLRERISPGISLLLVGAGLIGLEVAASASKMGAKVTVVETADRPLSRLLPASLSNWLADAHRQAGVRILCGRQVVASAEQRTGAVVTLDDGRQLEAQLILVGIGGVPNDGLARAAGLEVGDGIVVNEYGQTNDPVIYAVGDVAFHINPIFATRWRLESWKNAEDQAAVAAAHICGNPIPYHEVPWFWTDQYDINIQVAGVPGAAAPSLVRGAVGERGYLAYFLDNDRLRGAIGIGCGRDIRIARESIKAGGRIDFDDLRKKGFVMPLEGTLEQQRRAS